MPVLPKTDLYTPSSCLDEGGPVCEFLLPVNGQDAVAVPVQAILPYQAIPEGRERRVDLHGHTEAVSRGDGAFGPAPSRSWVTVLEVASIPTMDDGVSLCPVVSRHPDIPYMDCHFMSCWNSI